MQAFAQVGVIGCGEAGIELSRQRVELLCEQHAQGGDGIAAAEAVVGGRIVEQRRFDVVGRALGNHAGAGAERASQAVDVDGFREHARETARTELAFDGGVAVGRRRECRARARGRRDIGAQPPQRLRAVEPRHTHVEQQHVIATRAGQGQRGFAVAGSVAAMAQRRGRFGKEAQAQRIVVGDQELHATSPFRSRWPQSAPLSGAPCMHFVFRVICIVLALGIGSQARAAGLRAAVDTLQAGGIVVKKIQVELMPSPEGGQDLRLTAAQLDWPEVALQLVDIEAHCPLEPDAAAWRCAGQARLRTATGAQPLEAGFVAQLEQGRLSLELNRAPARLSLNPRGEGEDLRWQVRLRQLPLDWLSDLLRKSWPVVTRLDGQLALDAELPAGDAASTEIDYSLRDFGFDTVDGSKAAAHVSLAGKLEWHDGTPWRLRHRGQIGSGEVLAGAFHVAFADHGTRLDFGLAPERDAYRVSDLVFDDPGVLRLAGAALVAPAAPNPLRALDIESATALLPQAQQRYLASLLGLAGWGELQTRGRVTARGRFDAQGPLEATLVLAPVDVAEKTRGVGIDALEGELAWRRDGELAATELRWKSAQLYSLPLGAARLHWQSRDGALSLREPARIPLLGGSLDLLRLGVHPAAVGGERVKAGLAVHDVELSALSQALGWPRFGGKLGGAVPELRYADERLELTGGLMLDVFDGTLNVTGLALERPFGVSPSLSADIAFEKLDLSLLTGTFDIGGITGRLSGYVRALRLVDWRPVAFDAQLQALDGGRISQRAVNTISSVGGGGIAAGLQASMLKLFDTFGYSRLGIGCRLQNAVCHMRGLDADAARYTLVEGRGLPRIQIVGHQSQVDWAVLVDRLQAAARGTKPVIH